jgi:hypothetical protein
LQPEGEQRTAVEGEIVEEVTHIRTGMQEFVNKQLLGWIQEGIASWISNCPQAPPTLTIDQIREVVHAEQPKINPFSELAQREKREREYQKEMEAFTKWIKEQWKEVEVDMEESLAARTEHIRKVASKPPTIFEEKEGEASGAVAARLARWASLLPPSENPAIPPSPRVPSLPPPPPKSKKPRVPPSFPSSSSSSSSEGGRHQRGWTKGPKGRKGEK